jgi:hypothetical protein
LAGRAVFSIPGGFESSQLPVRSSRLAARLMSFKSATTARASFPAHIAQAGSDQMHDAALYGRVRVSCLNRLQKPFQSTHTGDEDIFQPAVLQLGQHAQPELSAFIGAGPKPQHFFVPLHIDANSHVYGAVFNLSLLAHLHRQRV